MRIATGVNRLRYHQCFNIFYIKIGLCQSVHVGEYFSTLLLLLLLLLYYYYYYYYYFFFPDNDPTAAAEH